MSRVYIDGEYRCHATAAEGRTAAESEFFDGKGAGVIYGYRFIPAGQSYTRADGAVFRGEMITPIADSALLEGFQAQAERSEEEHCAEAAALVEMIYDNDMEVIG